MTLKDIKEMAEDFLTPDTVAKAMGVTAQSIRDQARLEPTMLGFPVAVIGNKTIIPREAFLKWAGHEN